MRPYANMPISLLLVGLIALVVSVSCGGQAPQGEEQTMDDVSRPASTSERPTPTREGTGQTSSGRPTAEGAATRESSAGSTDTGGSQDGSDTTTATAEDTTPTPEELLELLRPGLGLEVPPPSRPLLMASKVTVIVDGEEYPLHQAAYDGDLDEVIRFLDEGEYVNTVAEATASIKRGDSHIYPLVNIPIRGDKPKYNATNRCYEDCFSPELPETRTMQLRVSPLHLAVISDAVGVVEYLVEEADAKVDQLAVEYAVMYGSLNVMTYLFPIYGGKDAGGLLTLAVQHREPDLEKARFLAGEADEFKDRYVHGNATPLHYAAALNNGVETIELLLESGIEASIQTNRYARREFQYLDAAAFAARYNPSPKVLAFLIDAWFDENIIGARHMTEERAEGLIYDYLGSLLVHSVNYNTEPAITGMLIDWGADVDVGVEAHSTDWSALEWAMRAGFADFTLPHVELLIENGANLEPEGFLPLSYSAQDNSGSTELVALLIENGADVNERGDKGRTPLHQAISGTEWLNMDMVRFLANNGGNINAKDEDGVTPSYIAMWVPQNGEITKELIELGMDATFVSKDGYTALHAVMSWIDDHPKDGLSTLEVLLDNGADPTQEGGIDDKTACYFYGMYARSHVERSHLSARMGCP